MVVVHAISIGGAALRCASYPQLVAPRWHLFKCRHDGGDDLQPAAVQAAALEDGAGGGAHAAHVGG